MPNVVLPQRHRQGCRDHQGKVKQLVAPMLLEQAQQAIKHLFHRYLVPG
jgi:hypothetical protein